MLFSFVQSMGCAAWNTRFNLCDQINEETQGNLIKKSLQEWGILFSRYSKRAKWQKKENNSGGGGSEEGTCGGRAEQARLIYGGRDMQIKYKDEKTRVARTTHSVPHKNTRPLKIYIAHEDPFFYTCIF
jgi:hypothetical protein